MALIKCPECGKEISDTCEQCIHCGYKLKNPHNGYLSQSPQNLNISSTTEHIKQESEYMTNIVLACVLIVMSVIAIIVGIVVSSTLEPALFLIICLPGLLLLIIAIAMLVINKRQLNKYYR